jgi:hypothetical protein
MKQASQAIQSTNMNSATQRQVHGTPLIESFRRHNFFPYRRTEEGEFVRIYDFESM